MNFRTTFALLILVVVGVGGFLVWNPEAPEKGAAPPEPEVTRELFDPKPETIVKLRLERPDKDAVAFEKDKKSDAPGEYDKWRLVAPFEAKAVDWSVNSLANKIRDLKYRQQDDTIKDDVAGLSPPRATVSITDAGGTERTVEIGKTAAGNNTFVRLKDKPTVYIVDGKFDDDLKKKLDEYRDKDLVELASADADAIRVLHDGETYAITRDDKKDWIFSEPFTGYGDNTKIKSIADNLNWLRADEFIADQPEDLKVYGLDAPRLTVEVTTVKEVEAETDAEADAEDAEGEPSDEEATEEEEASEPTIERTTFQMVFGAFADLEEKKVYAKIADQPFVVTVNKTDYDKFVPKPNEWRDLKITRSAARTTTKVELEVGGEKATLTKEGSKWTSSDGEADIAAVDGMLKAIVDLKATQYRDGDPAEFGLDKPRAVLTLTVPGQTDPETITVGGESKSGTMAYVRRGTTGSVGVVRADDVAKLVQPPVAYRDRKILQFVRNDAQRIELSRRRQGGDGRQALVLEKDGAQWSLTSPIEAEAERQAVRDMLADLSSLRAKTVIGRGDGTAQGLNDPDALVKVTVESRSPPAPASKPAETQPTTAAAEGEGEPKAAEADAEPPEPVRETYDLAVTKTDDKVYARHSGSDLVYEIDSAVHDHLMAEILDRTVAQIESSQVTDIEIARAGQADRSHRFAKKNDAWTYVTDPDVIIDETKVTALVDKFVGLKAERFVAYKADDLAKYGLDRPEYTLTVTRDDGDPVVLLVGTADAGGAPDDRRYATVRGSQRVILLKDEDIKEFDKSVADFEKTS